VSSRELNVGRPFCLRVKLRRTAVALAEAVTGRPWRTVKARPTKYQLTGPAKRYGDSRAI
jgi:hypothetical protein